MSETKEERREKVMTEYSGTSGRPPSQRCAICGVIAEKLMEVNGKPLCRDCLKIELDSNPETNDVGLTRVYGLMERLKYSDRRNAPRIIINIWESIKVKGVTVNRGRKENYYHITLTQGEIILNETESLNCTKFRIEFQRIHGVLLPNLPNTQWSCLLTEWLAHREMGIEVEEISEQQEVIDSILEHITASRLIKGTGASIFGTVYLHDDAILVPNESIKNISSKINRSLQLRKVSSILSEYLIGPTKTYRTTEGVVRMWRFDPAKLEINTKDAIELCPGEEDD